MTGRFAPLKRFIDPLRPITYGIVQAGEHVPDGVPYIRPVDMTDHDGVPDPDELLRTSREIAETYERSRVSAGDVVVSIGPSFGKVMIVPDELAGANLTQGTARLAPGPGVDSRWLYWALQSALARSYWSAAVGGATFRALNLGPLGASPLPVTDRGTQREVAEFLDCETARIDGIMALRERLSTLLAERRVEMRRTAFGTAGPGRRRLPWLPPISDDWQVLPLRWVADCLDGRRVPLNSDQRSGMLGDIPYWGANGIADWVDDYLFDTELVLLGEDGAPFFEPERDVAFFVTDRVWVNNHIHVLRPIGVRPRYLTHYLNLVDYAAFITGTTRDKLTQEEMGRIPVPVPPDEEQLRIERQIEEHLPQIEDLTSRVRTQIRLLGEHRHALITASVTGNSVEALR